jgi:hypothetical protein
MECKNDETRVLRNIDQSKMYSFLKHLSFFNFGTISSLYELFAEF